jgi:hypothetical protein
VLDEDQRVLDLMRLALRHELLLQLPDGAVFALA